MSALVKTFGLTSPAEVKARLGVVMGSEIFYPAELNREDADLVRLLWRKGNAGEWGEAAKANAEQLLGCLKSAGLDAPGEMQLQMTYRDFAALAELLLDGAEFADFSQAASLRIDLLSSIGIEEI
ncbi:MAG: hypothetical protein JHD02_00060 [Thermoleophilaceae bacterium]|nr:hypothetical protein [Thermoleophilaceae bacterium]